MIDLLTMWCVVEDDGCPDSADLDSAIDSTSQNTDDLLTPSYLSAAPCAGSEDSTAAAENSEQEIDMAENPMVPTVGLLVGVGAMFELDDEDTTTHRDG